MALSKKKSRQITVADQKFRWQFFDDSGFSTVTVQLAIGSGQKLVVRIPGPAHVNDAVTPAVVERLITSAKKLGWAPTQNGRTFETTWEDGEMTTFNPI